MSRNLGVPWLVAFAVLVLGTLVLSAQHGRITVATLFAGFGVGLTISSLYRWRNLS